MSQESGKYLRMQPQDSSGRKEEQLQHMIRSRTKEDQISLCHLASLVKINLPQFSE